MKVVTGMSIDEGVREALKRIAKEQNRTFSNLCETILTEYIVKNSQPEKPPLKRREAHV